MKMNSRHKLIQEGDFVAEIEVSSANPEEPWGPCLSLEDTNKLDAARKALRRGDIKSARELGRVYSLVPVDD